MGFKFPAWLLIGNCMPSSVISGIRYDRDTGCLRVKFVSGHIYDYKDVPEKFYNLMKRAASKGSFFEPADQKPVWVSKNKIRSSPGNL
jgi:hypothetical protein